MTMHSIGDVKVNLGRILRDLNHGAEVIITRQGGRAAGSMRWLTVASTTNLPLPR